MTRHAALLATCFCLSIAPALSQAQEAGPLAPAAAPAALTKPAPAKKPKPGAKQAGKTASQAGTTAGQASKTTGKAKLAGTPKAPEPWALADPARAGLAGAQAAHDVPTPGQPRTAPASDDKTSFGMKWNSSNTPNYGPMSTSGLMNSYNNSLNGTDGGTTVETGVKFKF